METQFISQFKNMKLPIFVEKDEDGFYIVECPLLSGCFTQGKTLKEALSNIREVIELCLEDEPNADILHDLKSSEFSLHNITL